LSGIQITQKKKAKLETEDMEEMTEDIVKLEEEEEEETEDQKAMRAILAGAGSTNGQTHDGPIIDIIIPQPQHPISETDAYRQDVQEFPDEATLDDYARVPVSQFGAALLRGMGWKEGAPVTASSKGKKHVEPWLPVARPALLGIGAKEQEVYDDGSGKGKKGGAKSRHPEKRYVPLVKKEARDGSGSGRESGRESRRNSPPPPSRRDSAPRSRRASRSPSPSRRLHRERDRDRRDYDRDYDRRRGDRDGDSRRERRDKRDY
jgi:hypothetical protein